MKPIKVLSLFDGMSCGRIALDQLTIPVDTYYASEIDKYAMKVSKANYPDIIQLGDVLSWREWDIEWASIDLVTGGFPCQAWSLAGKQLGDKDERGKMFWVMLDIMKKVLKANPKAYYLMENVRMKKEFEDYITTHTQNALPNVNKYMINSALVSAQNRVRFYWTNIDNVLQPSQRNIFLKDILEDGYIPDRDKSYCIDANYYKGASVETYKKKSRRQLVFKEVQSYREVRTEEAKRLRKEMKQKTGKDYTPFRAKKLVPRDDGKVGTLTTSLTNDHKISIEYNSIIRDKSKTVRSSGRGSYDKHEWDSVDKLHWRKLTPTECERLQTVPENYTNYVSNTQRYKMLGNGWTVEIIKHIFKNMKHYKNEKQKHQTH